MIRILKNVLLVSSLLLLYSINVLAQPQEWRFKVYLDNTEIGYHHFRINQSNGIRDIVTEAEFNVRFLFFNAYRYKHLNNESWRGNCLASITSQTDDNGRSYRVTGNADETGFIVDAGIGAQQLPNCVMSFAYWDPAILKAKRLLNAQTGEYIDIEVTALGKQTLILPDQTLTADCYRLQAETMTILLWYSQEKEWLALQSTTDSGRSLRYSIQQSSNKTVIQ